MNINFIGHLEELTSLSLSLSLILSLTHTHTHCAQSQQFYSLSHHHPASQEERVRRKNVRGQWEKELSSSSFISIKCRPDERNISQQLQLIRRHFSSQAANFFFLSFLPFCLLTLGIIDEHHQEWNFFHTFLYIMLFSFLEFLQHKILITILISCF